MGTTTYQHAAGQLVIPEAGQTVEITYGPDHVVTGLVAEVDADSFLVIKHTEYEDGSPLLVPEGDTFSLFHVEQADALCTVAVLS